MNELDINDPATYQHLIPVDDIGSREAYEAIKLLMIEENIAPSDTGA